MYLARAMIERKWSVHYGGLAAGRDNGDFYFHRGRLSPEYGEADRKAWDAGGDFTMKPMWGAFKLSFDGVTRLDTP